MRPPRWTWRRWFCRIDFVPSAWLLGVYRSHLGGGAEWVVYPLPMLRFVAYRPG